MPSKAEGRLYLDCETAPNVALTWRAGYKLTIPYENIVQERAIICVAWSWEGAAAVDALTWSRHQCDRALLTRFSKVLRSATEVVAFNGDHFDIPWLRTRCLYHGIQFPPDLVSIDPLKYARSKFYFNSNRLDYLAQFLGVGSKKPTGFDLWKRIVLDADPVALRKMVTYCKHDVRILKGVWAKLNPYVPHKTHRGRYIGDCPECGGTNVVREKVRMSAAGYERRQLRCTDCGKYHTIAASREGLPVGATKRGR